MADTTVFKNINVAYCEEFPEKYVDDIKRICSEKGAGFRKLEYDDLRSNGVGDCDVFFGEFDPDILNESPSIKWLQSSFAGVDSLTPLEVFRSGRAVLTNAGGAYDDMISEYLLGGAIALLHNFFYYKDRMNEHHWAEHIDAAMLKGKKVTVLGCGKIGCAFARKADAMGAVVSSVTMTEKKMPDFIKRSVTIDSLDEILRDTEILVMMLPLSEGTVNIMNKTRLGLLPEGALVLNAGRGKTLDIYELKKLLDSNYLGGAMIDVFESEPILPDSPLWDTANLVITPHISGHASDSANIENIIDIFEENLDRYIKGEKLINVIDVKRGY